MNLLRWIYGFFTGRDKIFCKCTDPKHAGLNCVEPNSVIEALHDACDEMSYNNWANDRFNRAEEVIRKYCKEQKIPMRFKYSEDKDVENEIVLF